MQFSELQSLVEIDLKIDDTELDLEAIRTPQLHGKYLNFYTQFTLQLKKAEEKIENMHKVMGKKKNPGYCVECFETIATKEIICNSLLKKMNIILNENF